MKKCPKCQGECLEESKFCAICGHKFEDNTAEVEITNEENTNMEKDESQLEVTNEVTEEKVNEEVYEVTGEVVESEPEFTGQQNNDGGNKGNKLIVGIAITAIVAVLALASVLVFGKGLFDKRNPEDKLVDAYKQFYDANTIDMTYKIRFSELDMSELGDAEAALVANIMKDISCDLNVKFNKDEHIMQGVLDINLQETNMINAYFYANEELIGINVPFIHDDTFYVTWDSVFNKLKEEEGIDINWKDYIELIDKDTYTSIKDIDTKKYTKLYTEFIKEILGTVTKEAVRIGDKNVSCSKYPLELDYAKSFAFGFKILDELAADEDVKALIFEVVDKVSEKIIENEDYVYMYLTEEEIKDGVNEIKSGYQEMLDELDGKSIIEKIAEAEGMDVTNLPNMLLNELNGAGITVKTDVYLDKNNSLRKIDLTEEIKNTELGINVGIKAETIINSMNKKIEFDGVDKTKAINPLELTEEEMEKLMIEIQANVMKQLMTNPIFSQFLGGSMF